MAIAAERMLAGVRDEMLPTAAGTDRGDGDDRRGHGATPRAHRR